jgi:hypothetical protein
MKKPLLLPLLCLSLATLPTQAQWTSNTQQNTVVQDVAGTQEVTPLAAAGPAGGTWVSWFESAPSINYQMRAQLLDRNGNKLLGPNGVIVSSQQQGTALFRYDLKSDAAGNAIIAFQETRGGSVSQCVVYKVSPTGQQLWGANGIQLLDPTAESGLSPTIAVLNSGNVVIAWNASGSTGSWVAFQKFSPTGTALWTAPQRVQGAPARYTRGFPVASGADDVVLEYVRQTGSGLGVSTVFAQRYDASGTAVWATPTQVSDKTIGFAYFPAPISDGAGGYFVALNSGNPASATLGDVWVQRVRADGSLWSLSGTEALTGATTARFDGRLDYVAAQNTLYAAINVTDTSQGMSGISVQLLNPLDGTRQLAPAGGNVVFTPNGSIYAAQALRDVGTGLVIVYTQNTNALNRLLAAHKISYQGAPAFFPTGSGNINLSDPASPKQNYSVLPYASNQLVTVWADQRTDSGVYAQSIDDMGRLGVLGLRNGHDARPLALSPNPGRAPVLQLDLPRAQALSVQVRDLSGRLVRELSYSAAAGATQLKLDAPELAAGVYLVETQVAGVAWRARWVKE